MRLGAWSPASVSGPVGGRIATGRRPDGACLFLLEHSWVKISERHYAPWVQARQAQLEADLARAWRNDPIAQAEMLAGTTSPNREGVRMAATYPRHETGKATN
jgi:hypothetical protein